MKLDLNCNLFEDVIKMLEILLLGSTHPGEATVLVYLHTLPILIYQAFLDHTTLYKRNLSLVDVGSEKWWKKPVV
nr:unnamed protein product [Callosobruchus chinensis]